MEIEAVFTIMLC